MRQLIALCLIAAPAFAEDAPPVPEDDGFSLMEEGMKLVKRRLHLGHHPAHDQMDEAFSKLEPSLQELGPKLMSLMSMIDDVGNYDFPVMLPNGDILIRRNVPLVPVEPEPGPNGEIEL